MLVGIGHPEDLLLPEMVGQNLQADGQPLLAETARKRKPWEAGQIARDREDVREVHLQRIIHLLPQFEGRRGGRGHQKDIALGESFLKSSRISVRTWEALR